ncbi:TMCO4 family protein [Pleurotus pulmonarius]
MSVKPIAPVGDIFDDDDEGWQDMPVIREDKEASGLDEEDIKRYHYVTPTVKGSQGSTNATGAILDVDAVGQEWRSKLDQNESEYTRLRVNEEEDADEVHLRTRYLFDEDKAMTPLSQMQATKNLLTEAQRIAYVGLCALTSREMAEVLKSSNKKELKAAGANMELWAMKILGRLYYHMELETQEQKMIENLGQHGVQAMDLVPALMTTHTVANPEYDPAEARRQAEDTRDRDLMQNDEADDAESLSGETIVDVLPTPTSPNPATTSPNPQGGESKLFQTTAKVLPSTATAAIPGVSTSLSAADEKVTLDIRWTVLCDLFLVLIADSVYDARSRVLLENVAAKLGLGWIDVVKFESRVTEALEIQEDVEKMEHRDLIDGRQKAARKKRYMMLGLATLGGGLVIGLSAGLLAPVIGAGLGAAFTTIGITGTTGFLAGAGGAAVITTGGVLTGSGIAAKGMAKRTKQVQTFDVLPLHNNKRVNCILTVPGFMNGIQDDVRLPFSVLDPVVGDVFSVLWEPEMIRETGSALKILTGEVLTQLAQTALQATVMTALMSALQWPIILTKLGYLIDNPWNNALDRSRAAGRVLADVLIQRCLGVRPITLIGFSLGARVIFYALLELAKQKAFGIVQDVFLLGATLSVSNKTWLETRSVVSGRYVNAYARNDWVLNYLFRATSGGVGTVAGLRPIEGVPGLENVDVTDKIAGHMSYRTFMPLILDQLGFPVFADYFDEPEEPDFEGERVVITEEDQKKKKGWFSRKKSKSSVSDNASQPPSSHTRKASSSSTITGDDELPPRVDEKGHDEFSTRPSSPSQHSDVSGPPQKTSGQQSELPLHAGFDFAAIKEVLNEIKDSSAEQTGQGKAYEMPPIPPPSQRSESTPPTQRSTPVKEREALEPPLSAGGPRRSDLHTSFTRSLSVNDAEDDDGTITPSATSNIPAPFRVTPSQEDFGSFDNDLKTARPGAPPTLSFGDDDGAFWSPPPTRGSSLLPGPNSASPIASRGYSSFGASTTSFSSSTAFGLSPTHNPFSTISPPNSGLTFGANDGSITSLGSALSPSNDPWALPFDNKRKNDLGSNPWG